MFPIVFAAISGRSMKMIARYLAERGAKISVRTRGISSQVLPMQARTLLWFYRQLIKKADLRASHGQPVRLGYGRKSNHPS